MSRVTKLPKRGRAQPAATDRVPHVQLGRTSPQKITERLQNCVDRLPDFEMKETVVICPGAMAFWLNDAISLANLYAIVGDGAVIFVDTTEITKAAEYILAEFRKIAHLRVATTIFTQSHRDHVSCANVSCRGR